MLTALFAGGCSSLHSLDCYGAPADKLDIVIVASRHYSDDPACDPQWKADTRWIEERLLAHPLFAANRSRVDACRPDTVPCGDFTMTSFGFRGPDRTTVKALMNERARVIEFGHNDQIIFLVHGPS